LNLKQLPTAALASGSRVAFLTRRRAARSRNTVPAAKATRSADAPNGRRNILLITSDQQRFDSLGVNGGRVARTLALDALARSGINFRRAHVQNVVCMPSRSTMLTGQHPLTHGVVANGIPLPLDAPSVADVLRAAGYRTALIGKAHFDPHLDPRLRFFENRCAAEGLDGPWHGFEHMELATHGPVGGHHYAAWLWEHHPREVFGFGSVLSGARGGDTHAPEVAHNPVPREHYHTDWVAERTRAWLAQRAPAEPWFCWMSFPDPHHPFDPPFEEVRRRIDWRDVPLPEGHPRSRLHIETILRHKPRHWLDWYEGRFRNPEGGPVSFVPGALSEAQVREINAMIHVENELIDEACESVFAFLRERDIDQNTDVFFTSDHGELQGDFGLLFKGPYHVESLLHVPLIWRPAPVSGTAPAEIDEPVGHVDLAPTLCAIAGLDVPGWMQGAPLPTRDGSARQRVITTFDSQFAKVGMHLRTLYRDGYLCTAYEPTTRHVGGRFAAYWAIWGRASEVPEYLGCEGELYDLRNDPHQWENLWDDPVRRALRNELVADLRAHLPPAHVPALRVAAPT
jgi:arylsulfatase A-like enzyme